MKQTLILAFTALLISHAHAESVFTQKPVWHYQVTGKVEDILATNNSVFVASEDGIYCLQYSRTPKFFHKTNGRATSVFQHGDFTYVASSDGSIGRLDEEGNTLWERDIPAYVGYPGALAGGAHGVVCGSMDGFVYVLDEEGVFQWKRHVGSYVVEVRVFQDKIVAVSDRQVFILDPDGKVRRNLNITGYIRGSEITQDMIIVGLDDSTITAYEHGGNVLFTYQATEYAGSISAGGEIYAGTGDKKLISFSENGTVNWVRNLSDSVICVKAQCDRIMAATLDNKVYLFSDDGGLRWSYETDGRATTLSMQDTHLVSGTTTGNVYYSRLPRRNVTMSFLLSFAIIILVAAAIMVVSKSWS